MPKYIVVFLLCGLLSFPAYATSLLKNYIPDASVVGSGRLTYLLWDVYDATLYGPSGSWSFEKPFALSLNYRRVFSGKDIADSTIDEIRKLGFNNEKKLDSWYKQMLDIFPDVKKGTELIGVYVPNEAIRFYQGEERIGEIKDPEFSQTFFNIWLSENSSVPNLRKKLLGL